MHLFTISRATFPLYPPPQISTSDQQFRTKTNLIIIIITSVLVYEQRKQRIMSSHHLQSISLDTL